MLEFVDSGLYFVQDEYNLINPLLQVGSGSGSNEKIPDPAGKNSTDPTGSISLGTSQWHIFYFYMT